MYLIFRGICPKASIINAAASYCKMKAGNSKSDQNLRADDVNWFSKVQTLVLHSDKESITTIPSERQIGFLHLVENIVQLLGFLITDYVLLLGHLVMEILVVCAQSGSASIESTADDADEDDEVEGESMAQKNASDMLRIRKLGLLRLCGKLFYHLQRICL
jgi:hypothetical protein